MFCRISPKDWDDKIAREAANPMLSVTLAADNTDKKVVEDGESVKDMNSCFLTV